MDISHNLYVGIGVELLNGRSVTSIRYRFIARPIAGIDHYSKIELGVGRGTTDSVRVQCSRRDNAGTHAVYNGSQVDEL